MQNEAESSAHFQPEVKSFIKTQRGTTMKKFMALALLTMLVLALCLPIIARYEICAYCQSARLQRQTEKTTAWCDTCGKKVSAKHVYMYCPNCENREDWGIEKDCGH